MTDSLWQEPCDACEGRGGYVWVPDGQGQPGYFKHDCRECGGSGKVPRVCEGCGAEAVVVLEDSKEEGRRGRTRYAYCATCADGVSDTIFHLFYEYRRDSPQPEIPVRLIGARPTQEAVHASAPTGDNR